MLMDSLQYFIIRYFIAIIIALQYNIVESANHHIKHRRAKKKKELVYVLNLEDEHRLHFRLWNAISSRRVYKSAFR